MSEKTWTRVPLSEVCESIIDCVNKTAPVAEGPTEFKMIRTTNVRDGWVDLTTVKYVTEEVYQKWTRRQVPIRGDVILTREAPLGEVGMLKSDERVFLGQRLMSYRADPAKLDNRFLLYSFQCRDLQDQIRALGGGSTVEHMRVPDAENLTILLPSLETQSQIADTLSAYDDLIENNTRRIAILEEMAQRLYREWFVHFRYPGHDSVPLVESDLGLIPEGWRVEPLGKVVEVSNDNISPRNAPETIVYVDIASVGTGVIGSTKRMRFVDAPGRARRPVRHRDIIWSTVRPNRKSYALVLNPSENTVASTGLAVLRAISIPYEYLYLAVTTENFVDYLINRARGAAYPAVTGSDFEEALLLVPDQTTLHRFVGFADPLLQQFGILRRQVVIIESIRNLLLPHLIRRCE